MPNFNINTASYALYSRGEIQGDDPLALNDQRIPLEIIAPQEGLTTGVTAPSRYYRAYPGLVWDVPIVVFGGNFPFNFEIISAPAGVTVDNVPVSDRYGVLQWLSPVAGAHTISVRVTDASGVIDTHTWALTVTTDNTLFVDATNGDDSNVGTLVSPLASIQGWWGSGAGSRDDAQYAGYHIYYRGGTYYTGYGWDSESVITGQMKMREKPHVHLNYPGETATFDLAGDGGATFNGGQFFIADGPVGARDDVFFGGMNFIGVCSQATGFFQKGLGFNSADRINVFNCNFSQQAGPGVSGQNPTWIFMIQGGSIKTHISLTHCDIQGLDSFMFLETYDVSKVVLDNNSVSNDVGGITRLAYFKVNSVNISVRNNTGLINTNAYLTQVGSSEGSYDEIETCWNNWRVTGATTPIVWHGIESDVSIGACHVYSNTLTGGTVLHQNTTGGGPVLYKDNVRQYGAGIDGITDSSPLFEYTVEGDLVATSGLVDPVTNELTGASRTLYLGRRGHEID